MYFLLSVESSSGLFQIHISDPNEKIEWEGTDVKNSCFYDILIIHF